MAGGTQGLWVERNAGVGMTEAFLVQGRDTSPFGSTCTGLVSDSIQECPRKRHFQSPAATNTALQPVSFAVRGERAVRE